MWPWTSMTRLLTMSHSHPLHIRWPSGSAVCWAAIARPARRVYMWASRRKSASVCETLGLANVNADGEVRQEVVVFAELVKVWGRAPWSPQLSCLLVTSRYCPRPAASIPTHPASCPPLRWTSLEPRPALGLSSRSTFTTQKCFATSASPKIGS